jgi:hypothetical protein
MAARERDAAAGDSARTGAAASGGFDPGSRAYELFPQIAAEDLAHEARGAESDQVMTSFARGKGSRELGELALPTHRGKPSPLLVVMLVDGDDHAYAVAFR